MSTPRDHHSKLAIARLQIVGNFTNRQLGVVAEEGALETTRPGIDRETQLSAKDRQILELLRQDARRSVSEMAARTGLSRQTVKDRMDWMTGKGIIKRYTVEVDDRRQIEANAESAFFLIRLKRPVCRIVFASIEGWPELLGCWSIAGDLDMVVLINASSNSEIERLRDTLARHPEVHRLQTLTVLRDWITRSQSQHPKAQALLNDYTGLPPGDMIRM